MTKPESPFTLGTKVVFVNTHYRRRIGAVATITKVTPAGKFRIKFAQGHEPDCLYKPDQAWNGRWTASKVGSYKYSSEHLEPFDDSILAEMAEANARHEAQRHVKVVSGRLEALDLSNPENRELVKRIMDMLPLTYAERKEEAKAE